MRKEHRLHRLEGEAFKEGGHVTEFHIHLGHGGEAKHEKSHKSLEDHKTAHKTHNFDRSEHFKKHTSAFSLPHESKSTANGIVKKVNTPAERLVTGSPDAVRVKKGGPIEASEGKWIQKAIKPSTKGALHKELNVPIDSKIPMKMIKKAEHSPDTKLAKRAHLAETMRHFRPRSR